MSEHAVKLVVTDLDDTLLDPDKNISAAAVEAIAQLASKNIKFTFITGRPPYAVSRFAQGLAMTAPMVCCNGALICDTEKTYHLQRFSIGPLKGVMEEAAQLGMTVLLYDGTEEYALTETEWTESRRQAGRPVPLLDKDRWEHSAVEAVKMNIMAGGKAPQFEGLKPQLAALISRYAITLYGSTGCEIVAPGVNKATGLAQLCRLLGIAMGNVLAIGDNENDNEMMQEAGFSAAVANAVPSTKGVAGYLCAHSFTEGVVEAIEKFAL